MPIARRRVRVVGMADADRPPSLDAETPPPAPDAPRTAAGLRTAFGLLLPIPIDRNAPAPPTTWQWLLPAALPIGLAWMWTFRPSWRIFGEVVEQRLMPMLVLLIADVALFSRRLHEGALHTMAVGRDGLLDESQPLSFRQQQYSWLWTLTLLLSKYILLLSLPEGPYFWPSDWRAYLAWAYPEVIYRPLVLAPLWSAWGIVLAFGMGRPHPQADALTRSLMQSSRPSHAILAFFPLAALTTIYCGRDQHWMLGTIIALLVFTATSVAGVLLARRQNGHTFDSLTATGLSAQMSFLLIYVAFSQDLSRF